MYYPARKVATCFHLQDQPAAQQRRFSLLQPPSGKKDVTAGAIQLLKSPQTDLFRAIPGISAVNKKLAAVIVQPHANNCRRVPPVGTGEDSR